MPKSDLAVSALLQNLTAELDRKKLKKMEDLMLAKVQSSVHGRLGPRINEQNAQISPWQGGKFCGAIFMCNKRTWKECLRQSLFGLPIGKKGLVEQIIPGMKLFLFEFERRQLWGVFEAATYGGMDIIPNAYTGGSFPCQVRVKVPEECVALYEDEFCEAIRDNYYSLGKFHFDLSEKQVCHLTSLFERKYLSANILQSNLLEYEDKQHIFDGCTSNGGLPLLLTTDATSLYPEELLQNSWYSSSCQVTNGPFFLNSEEDRDHSYKNGESRTRRKRSEKGSLITLPNGALDIVQNNVASLTGELGKGFDNVNTSCLTFYDSNTHVIVEDVSAGGMSLFSDNMSSLHSDRPIAKSVWARISGRSKALGALETIQTKKSPEVTPVISPPKVCTIVEMDVEEERLFQDQDLEAQEEFSVGFKRRRLTKNNISAETPSKRRRKLTRPSFEDAADKLLVEQDKCVVENPPLPSPSGALDFSKSRTMAGIVEDSGGNISALTELPMKSEEKVCSSCDVSKFTVADPGEGIVRMNAPGCSCENGNLQPAHDVSQTNIDLNLPLEASLQNDQGVAFVLDSSPVLKVEKQCTTDATASQVSRITKAKSLTRLEEHAEPFNERGPNSLVCEMQQEPCCLALSLATQETTLHSREGINDRNSADLIGYLRKQQSEVLAFVEDVDQDKVDKAQIFVGESEQGKAADGEGVKNETGCLGKEVQGSDMQQPNSVSLDLAAADNLRTTTFSLAPCTPAKEFLDSSYAVSEQCDERKGLSHNLAQDIPLTLELGNGAQLPNVKLRLDGIIQPEQALGNSYKREDGDNAVVHDESFDGNQSRETKTISLDCTSSSNLPNQVDLQSFLCGLQVSGIRLQLGASPCLIVELGDSAGSTSNLDREDQGGATPGQSEPS